MTPAAAVLGRLRDLGLSVEVEREPDGLLLKVEPGARARRHPDLLAELWRNSPGVLELLNVELGAWPARCRAWSRWAPGPGAHLRPLVGGPVETPLGPARLLAVEPAGARVELAGRPGRSIVVGLWEIAPLGAGRAGAAAGAAGAGGAG